MVAGLLHDQIASKAARILNDDGPGTEGGAEFASELISGEVAYSQLSASTKGHELEIERAFTADKDKTDLSKWLNNGTLQTPGDLGYWVGYRIVKSYYQHATDKRRALREILQMTDSRSIACR